VRCWRPADAHSRPSEAVRSALLAASEPDWALEALRGAVVAASESDMEALAGALLAASEPAPLGPGLAAVQLPLGSLPEGAKPSPLGPGLCRADHVVRARQDAGKCSYVDVRGGLLGGKSQTGFGIGSAMPETANALCCSTPYESEEDWDTIFEHGASPSEAACSDSSHSDPAETDMDSQRKVEALLTLAPGLTACPHGLVSSVALCMVRGLALC